MSLSSRFQAQRRKALAPRYDTSLVLRRGVAALPAQLVALVVLPRASRDRRSEGSQGQQADVEVWGPPALDIAVGDRFTWGGSVCEVLLVRPERTSATVADAVTIQ